MSKKIVIVRNKKPVRVKRRRVVNRSRFSFPVGVECNVKVQGERTMMKHVRLVPFEDNDEFVKVMTGQPGRPKHLPVERIERVRPLY